MRGVERAGVRTLRCANRERRVNRARRDEEWRLTFRGAFQLFFVLNQNFGRRRR